MRAAGPSSPGGPAIIAIDLGAESCRVSLLRWQRETPRITMVRRFANGPVDHGPAGLRWDLNRICAEVKAGLRQCAELAPEGIASVGVDGWAVDYVRLDDAGRPLAPPYCYRDPRTRAAMDAVHAVIPADELYARTGVQIQALNTIYQLYADKLAGENADARWVNLPEYLLHSLGAPRIAEATNASHTALLDPQTGEWDEALFAALGLDLSAAPPVVCPGTMVGRVGGELARLPAFAETRLIAPACHDTASAVAGIRPGMGTWAYLSSGTWSLLGLILEEPLRSVEAGARGFTNLRGADGRVLFHRGIAGMWLLRQCMSEWAEAWSLPELIEAARAQPAPEGLIDPDDAGLTAPGAMTGRINAQLSARGLAALPEGRTAAPQYANLIFHSLAGRYAGLLAEVAALTAQRPERLFVVGGGSRNDYLNALTAQAAGIPVVRGSTESATLGNLAIQWARLEQGSDGVDPGALEDKLARLPATVSN